MGHSGSIKFIGMYLEYSGGHLAALRPHTQSLEGLALALHAEMSPRAQL